MSSGAKHLFFDHERREQDPAHTTSDPGGQDFRGSFEKGNGAHHSSRPSRCRRHAGEGSFIAGSFARHFARATPDHDRSDSCRCGDGSCPHCSRPYRLPREQGHSAHPASERPVAAPCCPSFHSPGAAAAHASPGTDLGCAPSIRSSDGTPSSRQSPASSGHGRHDSAGKSTRRAEAAPGSSRCRAAEAAPRRTRRSWCHDRSSRQNSRRAQASRRRHFSHGKRRARTDAAAS